MTIPKTPPAERPTAGLLTEEQARKRVQEEKEFYGHLASYLVVNALLVVINLLTSPGYFWAIWPLLGWGIGLVSHAMSVFGAPGLGRSWEERRVRALTGADADEAVTARLRRLLDEELDSPSRSSGKRALPATPEAQSLDRLQRRIEHLEAIVTSRDWDLLDAEGLLPATPRLPLEEEPPAEVEDPARGETPEARAARLARRVR